MSWTCTNIDIIGLKKPTALDKVIESIPKPKGAIPNFGLPKWKVMPLESKIPMVPGPEGAYNFARRKIGKRLWTSSSHAEFNLNDPYCHEIKFTYDALHDKHLVPFFSKANNIQHLLRSGLITNNLEGKCSLKDYNIYRKYLRNLHTDSIRRELRKRTLLSQEKRVLEYAEEQAQNEVNKLKKRERLLEARTKVWTARKQQEEAKLRAQREKAQKLKERMKLLTIAKQEEQMMRIAKAKARSENIRQKQNLAAEIQRQKIIQTLVDWRHKEHIRKKAREARLKHDREEKLKAIEEKWKLRQEVQKREIEKEQFLFECINTQRAEFLEKYNETIKKERERMDNLLDDMKTFVRCYMARRLTRGKERICCRRFDSQEFKDDETQKSKTNVRPLKDGKKRKLLSEHKRVPKVSQQSLKVSRKGKKLKKKSMKRKSDRKLDEEQVQMELSQEPEPVTETTAEVKEESKESLPEPKDKCKCQLIQSARKQLNN